MIGALQAVEVDGEQVAMEAARAGQQADPESDDADWGAGYEADADWADRGGLSERNFPAYVDTGLNLVDVEEIARMHRWRWSEGRRVSGTFWGRESDAEADLDRLAAITGLSRRR